MDKQEQKKIYSSITLHAFLIVLLLGVYFFYIQPASDELNLKIEESNKIFQEINDLKTKGVTVDQFQALYAAQTSGNKDKNFSNDLFREKAKIAKIIQPKGNDYLKWLFDEANKESILKNEIKENEKIIGSIIPTFYQYSDTAPQDGSGINIKEQITLDTFTDFIEKDIIGKFHLISYSSVGMQDVDFGDNDSSKLQGPAKRVSLTNTIGSFSMNLDFEGKNSDILKLIDYVQKSGRLEIDNKGKLIKKMKDKSDQENKFSSLDNLLITIDSLETENILLNNDKLNKGNLKLRFYVKGIGLNDLNNISSGIANKFELLYKNIQERGNLCENTENPICKDPQGSQSVAAIRGLMKEANLLKTKLDTIKKTTSSMQNTNLNSIISNWTDLSESIDYLSTGYNKSASYIDNFKKRGAK